MSDEARERWIGDTRVFVLDEGVIKAIVVGAFDTERAKKAYESTFELAKEFAGGVHLLVDLNKAGKSDPGARRLWKKMAEHPDMHKVAYYGLHPVARVIASFVTSVTTKEDVKFFKTEEDALAWLGKGAE